MHVIVAWDIKGEGPKWDRLNSALKDCIRGHSWVKPLSTLYIVEIDSPDDREDIRKALVAVCSENPGTNVLISPVMAGGSYNGWLPRRLWPKIRQRVEEDS